jgi:hypothetical protein
VVGIFPNEADLTGFGIRAGRGEGVAEESAAAKGLGETLPGYRRLGLGYHLASLPSESLLPPKTKAVCRHQRDDRSFVFLAVNWSVGDLCSHARPASTI